MTVFLETDLCNQFNNNLNISNYNDYKKINERTEKECCEETINKLSDDNLVEKIKLTDSYKKNKKEMIKDLTNSGINKQQIDTFLNKKESNKYLINAGVKGNVRGDQFNKIIKEYILSLKLDKKKFIINFETKTEKYITSEVPDFYIYDKQKNKILVGMNQVDLWRGGHQKNRGSKYISNNKNNDENKKLLCVVCNKKLFKKTNNTKDYKLFKKGYEDNTLCYIKNLKNIIFKFFNLELN